MEFYYGIEIIERLNINGCRVLVANVKPLGRNGMLEASLKRLSPYRREKTLRYRFDRGKWLSAGAGLLLDYMLKDYGLCERDMQYIEGEHGKPAFANHPQLHFNLSHSNSLVACAMGDKPVGVDVQHMVKLRQGLVRYTMSTQEIAKLEAMGTIEEKSMFFTQLWTLKESYVKATGRGLTHEFPSFDINEQGEVTALSALSPTATFKLTNLTDAIVSVAIINTDNLCNI